MKKLLMVSFIGVMFFCVGTAFATESVVLKLAHITAPGGMLDKKAQKFAELVDKKSSGKVKIEIYPAQQLGNIKELLQGLSMGTIDIVQEAESFMDTFDKDYAIFGTPFMFSREELKTNAYIDEVRERVRKKTGIRTLPGFAFRPAFHLWTQKKQILTPDELNGIKLRVWQSKALVDSWNGLGATAVPLAWGDVYLSLSQKVVDGMVHNIVQVRDEKFYEQLDYCTKLDFMQLYDVTWISDSKWQTLTPEIQKILTQASEECANWFVSYGQGLEAEAQQTMEAAGIKFTDGDPVKWTSKAGSVHKELEKSGLWSKGLLKKLSK
ncbi:MAG: TRAP transporter substrate-binding protein [Desulfobacula sp.]|uniref:TRAP transporter substrate-binding protein n=1 Tax=Desulfobacula sp. TaxID=2593537 RepID=UPI0025B99255|nr:TRAP transporter substrate-binding protein [Desulfobacula sp.]MCD4719958.1 TRAP transporter substrate-binding protein [Desulfobacula sp.]